MSVWVLITCYCHFSISSFPAFDRLSSKQFPYPLRFLLLFTMATRNFFSPANPIICGAARVKLLHNSTQNSNLCYPKMQNRNGKKEQVECKQIHCLYVLSKLFLVESALPAMADGWQKGKGMSIKDILTQEYQKSNEVVSFEEEMEEEVRETDLNSR